MSHDVSSDLLSFYRSRISELGFSYEAMWGDSAQWKSEERFKPLLSLPIKSGDVLVDIGCGTGALALFLKTQGIAVTYIGVEAVPEFAEYARASTGAEVIEIDGFQNFHSLPTADWYVTFGTLNKSWNFAQIIGSSDSERILWLFNEFYKKSRKGFAASIVTDHVDYAKTGVANMNPCEVMINLRNLTPHYSVFHGYSFYEFFASAWRGTR